MLLSINVVINADDSNAETASYFKTIELIKDYKYEQAKLDLQQQISNYPNGVTTASSYYWLGEIYLFEEKYSEAIQSFEQVYILSSNNPKAPSALYKIGIIYDRLGQEQKAQNYFRKVIKIYPSSPASELAKKQVIPTSNSPEDSATSKKSIKVTNDDFDKGLRAAQMGDFDTALLEWMPLALLGNIDAQYNLGVLYENGDGVTKDNKKALKWYTRAAEGGHYLAQFELGLMYENGDGITKDYKSAVNWYTKAALQGYAKAQYNLGIMYRNGEGVPESEKIAVKWFGKAAEQGLARAQYVLGLMYDSGSGVPENDKIAAMWYTRAAKQGHAGAQFNLGGMYEYGEGVLTDFVKAYMWFNIAAYNGIESGVESKKLVTEKMTFDDISKAQDMSIICIETDYRDCEGDIFLKNALN